MDSLANNQSRGSTGSHIGRMSLGRSTSDGGKQIEMQRNRSRNKRTPSLTSRATAVNLRCAFPLSGCSLKLTGNRGGAVRNTRLREKHSVNVPSDHRRSAFSRLLSETHTHTHRDEVGRRASELLTVFHRYKRKMASFFVSLKTFSSRGTPPLAVLSFLCCSKSMPTFSGRNRPLCSHRPH